MLRIENCEIDLQRIDESVDFLQLSELNIFASRVENYSGFVLSREGKQVEISFGEKTDFFRALGRLAIEKRDGLFLREERQFKRLGYLVDAARNAVPKIQTLKSLSYNWRFSDTIGCICIWKMVSRCKTSRFSGICGEDIQRRS